MSNDIATNQISKDVFNSSSIAKKPNAEPLQSRQTASVEEGKQLPSDKPDTKKVSDEELQQAVTKLNDQLQKVQRDLMFSIDDSSGQTIVRVVNTETEEVVRQMPTEEALRISRNIQSQVGDVSGLIFESSA